MHAEPVGSLSPELFAQWQALHDLDGGLTGPFLHPAYARAVSEVRSDVEVGIITENDVVAGFLPFQRSILGVGRPVGSRLCDMAGALVRPGTLWDPMALARAAGLRRLRLANVPASMSGFAPFQSGGEAAPVLDLSMGFERYRQASLDSGSDLMRQLARKARKMERDLGPLRFEWHTDESAALHTLLRWKAAQRRATRTPNILSLHWAQELVERLRWVQEEGFAGVLSTLRVGDTLAAVHFGIRTRDVMHYWVPAYNQELARYSPGLITLMELARAASERGVHRLDLGGGEERYKVRAATGAQQMRVTTVNTSATFQALSTVMDRGRSWSHTSRLGSLLRHTGRSMIRTSYAVRASLGRSASGASSRQTASRLAPQRTP